MHYYYSYTLIDAVSYVKGFHSRNVCLIAYMFFSEPACIHFIISEISKK